MDCLSDPGYAARTIIIQGRLPDADGVPVDGTFKLTFILVVDDNYSSGSPERGTARIATQEAILHVALKTQYAK